MLAASGTRGEPDVRFAIEPTEIAPVGIFPAWKMPALHVWMRGAPDRITIRVRNTVAALADPLPVPPPLVPTYLELTHPCRHCGQVPKRYRVLLDESLVCLACGRSQPVFG